MNLQLARNIPSVGDYSMNRNIEFFGYFLIGHPRTTQPIISFSL